MREMAAHATVPVINGLASSRILARCWPISIHFEEDGSNRGRKIAFVGDYNNVLSSWIDASARFDFRLEIACPRELQPQPAAGSGAEGRRTTSPWATTRYSGLPQGAAAVISDSWVSMGDEDEAGHDLRAIPGQSRTDEPCGRDACSCCLTPASSQIVGRVIDESRSGPSSTAAESPARAEGRSCLVLELLVDIRRRRRRYASLSKSDIEHVLDARLEQ